MTNNNTPEKKTLQEWAKTRGKRILDPDGFDRKNPNLMTELFTEEEFMKGFFQCTLGDYRDTPEEWEEIHFLLETSKRAVERRPDGKTMYDFPKERLFEVVRRLIQKAKAEAVRCEHCYCQSVFSGPSTTNCTTDHLQCCNCGYKKKLETINT